MEPALRRWYQDLIPRLDAERAMFWAVVTRAAQYDKDDFQQQMHYWAELARGAVIGNDIDPRGRPMTDSLPEFVAFYQGDPRTLAKYVRSN